MSVEPRTWEEAVVWLKAQPDKQDVVAQCYFDEPLLAAAERFSRSEEWAATKAFLPLRKARALDLGAGNGIASFALASEGWSVTALEPDQSRIIGAGAIRSLADEAGIGVSIVSEYGEDLPFEDESFEVVYCRQVLHHARDLYQLCKEVWRVLAPSGRFVATRDHVINHPEDLATFREQHPLHSLYGGESAYTLKEYERAIRGAGFRDLVVLGSAESVINYFPSTVAEQEARFRKHLERAIGRGMCQMFWRMPWLRGQLVRQIGGFVSWRASAPGRLYSFIATKR